MINYYILFLTLFFYLSGAIVLIYLIRITKKRMGWILISSGLLIIVFLRLLLILNRYIHIPFLSYPWLAPIMGLFVSLFLFTGFIFLIPVIKTIKNSEDRYRSIFDASGVSLWEEDLSELYIRFELVRKTGVPDFREYLKSHPEFVDESIKSIKVLDVNQATLDLFKVENKEKLMLSIGSTFTEKSREVFIEYLISIYYGHMVFESEIEYKDSEGTLINAILKIISPDNIKLGKHSIVSITDISTRYKTEKKLFTVLNEKNTLLKELYHRTKNNMQVIISMLNLHSYNLDNKIVTTAFNEMIGRIESMSLVHEKLYKSENLSVIKLDDYIDELIPLLTSTDSMWAPQIQIILDLDTVLVDIDKAIPCGLILNELFSNSYKHAFKNLDGGEIRIDLHNLEEDKVELIVTDDGIGLPSGFNLEKCETLGIQTIVALGEDQLHGSINFTTNLKGEGVSWRLVFTNNSGNLRI